MRIYHYTNCARAFRDRPAIPQTSLFLTRKFPNGR